MKSILLNHLISSNNTRMPILSGSWAAGLFVTDFVRRFTSSYHSTTERLSGSSSFSTKPPNILIYTGNQDTKIFDKVKTSLSRVLSRDSYTIYLLDENKVLRHPWSKNSTLLVIYSNKYLKKTILNEFKQFIHSGGKVISIGQGGLGLVEGIELKNLDISCSDNLLVEVDNLQVQGDLQEIVYEPFYLTGFNHDKVLLRKTQSGEPLAIYHHSNKDYHDNQGSKIILSSVDMLKDNCSHLLQAVLEMLDIKCLSNVVPMATPAFLLASNENKAQLLASLQPHLTEGKWCRGQVSLLVCNDVSTLDKMTVTEEELPLVLNYHEYDEKLRFDWKTYFHNLTTNCLGRIVVYTDVIHSTQTLLEGNPTFVKNIPKNTGVIAITNQQLKGKGRGGNAWLSPDGCMMFSIIVKIRFDSRLGCRLPFIQHIASLAFVLAVRSLPGYEGIDVRLKWPNDIYYRNTIKIGGVVVSSTATGSKLKAVIGMGVNISNTKPTICINDIIKQYNADHGTNLAPLQLALVLSRTVNCLEELIEGFQLAGEDSFREKYYKYWMHGGSKVTLNTGSIPEHATITGLDDYGFLVVKKDSGKVISLQPDGNTFDILSNLIEIKS